MKRKAPFIFLGALLAASALWAQEQPKGQAQPQTEAPAQLSEYPLLINLPTTDRMVDWDIGLVFTHRFVQPVKGHSKDMYGFDSMTYAGLGLTFGIKAIPGLNAFISRTADNKTISMGLQQQLFSRKHIRMALRAERYDEAIPEAATPYGRVGITGGAFQLPTEILFTDSVVLSFVPTYLTRTTTTDTVLVAAPGQVQSTEPNKGGIFNVGIGLRIGMSENTVFVAEYYPRPSKLAKSMPGGMPPDITSYQNGFAVGITYKTFMHRFTLVGTNALGTMANQVLSGDFGGGPRLASQWALGFNVTRVF